MKIPIDEIHAFKNHPFHVRQDEEMQKLIDSVQDNGILIPVLVRPDKNGNGYEMISGHRRKFALEYSGAKEIDAIVRDLDDDQATIIMVDSNIQRENILPTERGFAYRMKLEAMKRQVGRPQINSSQLGNHLKGVKSIDVLADEIGESKNQIHRYIRLTYLVKPLRDMVDGIHEDGFTIALNPAYELSFLTTKEQNELVHVIENTLATPCLAQSQEIKRKSQEGILSPDIMMDMLLAEKPNQKEKLSFRMEEINKYFPRSYTPNQKKELIIKLLGEWQKKKEKTQIR
ncbi:ParB/RepB/Spo0J family partition protein [Clostridium sp. C1]|nr:ParB/RepB/Spo0J family partition protein [Clostridium sp. C1]